MAVLDFGDISLGDTRATGEFRLTPAEIDPSFTDRVTRMTYRRNLIEQTHASSIYVSSHISTMGYRNWSRHSQ